MMSVFQALNICPWRTAEALLYLALAGSILAILAFPFRAYVILPLRAVWPTLKDEH